MGTNHPIIVNVPPVKGNIDKSEDTQSTQPTADNLSDDVWDLTDIKRHSIVADWYEDGVRCIVMRNIGFCGYVGIPENHPLAGFGYDDIPLDCHGGLTFCGEIKGADGWYFYGWDYSHSGDYVNFYKEIDMPSFGDDRKWTFGEVKQEVRDVLWGFKRLIKLSERIAKGSQEG